MNRLKTAFLAILLIGGGIICSSTNPPIKVSADELNFNNENYKSEFSAVSDNDVSSEILISDDDTELAKVSARFSIEDNYDHEDFYKSIYIPLYDMNTQLQAIQFAGVQLPYLHISESAAYQYYDVLFDVEDKYNSMDLYLYLATKQNDRLVSYSTASYSSHSKANHEQLSRIGTSLKYSFTTDKTDFYVIFMYRSTSVLSEYIGKVGYSNISIKVHNIHPDYGYGKTITGEELYKRYSESSSDDYIYSSDYLSVYCQKDYDADDTAHLSSYEFVFNGADSSLIDYIEGDFIFRVEFNNYPRGISIKNQYWLYANEEVYPMTIGVSVAKDINFIFNPGFKEIRFYIINSLLNDNISTCLKSISILPLKDSNQLSSKDFCIELGYLGHVADDKNSYNNGYNVGYQDGLGNGYNSGLSDGYTEGYSSGNTEGFNKGFNYGYQHGYEDSYDDIYDALSKKIPDDIYNEGKSDGYSEGYEKGKEDTANWWTKFCDFWVDLLNNIVNAFEEFEKWLGINKND